MLGTRLLMCASTDYLVGTNFIIKTINTIIVNISSLIIKKRFFLLFLIIPHPFTPEKSVNESLVP